MFQIVTGWFLVVSLFTDLAGLMEEDHEIDPDPKG